MSGQELTELIERVKAGEKVAFDGLVDQTQTMAKRLAFSVVGPNLVEDALQEAYILVFQKIEQVREPAAFRSWFCRVVMHVCYALLKRHPQNLELQEVQARGSESEQVLAAITLKQGLARLQQRDRDILILRDMLGLSYDEIADTLKIAGGTVRSRLHKARGRLAERLKG